MLSATAVLLSLLLLQLPPTLMVPPSLELKVYWVELSLVKVDTAVVSASVGAVVSTM
jgi:hypothetical protein